MHSCSLSGIDAFPVTVEAAATTGLPGYHVVGLPCMPVREGARRIRSALRAIGQAMPHKRVTVNLVPADLRKDGAALDLPIAMAVLKASGRLPGAVFADLLVVGELGLDGAVRPVKGVLSAALLARRQNLRGIVVPTPSAAEAAVVSDIEVYAVDHLGSLLRAVSQGESLPQHQLNGAGPKATVTLGSDMADVRGQAFARAAVEVAVAGGHNLLLMGPPGMGKTMIARRIPSILPPMTNEEALDVEMDNSELCVPKRKTPIHSLLAIDDDRSATAVHVGARLKSH